MRLAAVLLSVIAALPAQTSPDDQIRKEYEAAMELATAPSSGQKLDEEQAKARAESFRTALNSFLERWRPRVAELGVGRYHLARVLSMTGKPEEAVPLLRAFLAAHADAEDAEDAELLLGSALLDTNEVAGASAVFAGFLEKRPASDKKLVATFYLGVAHALQGRRDEAFALFRSVIETGGDSPLVGDAHLKLVEGLKDAGRVEEARKHLEGLLAEQPEAQALLALKEQLDWIGKEAPEFAGIDTWLGPAAGPLASLRGQVLVLNFFADRYDPCQDELRALAGLAPRFADKPVRMIGITRYYRGKGGVTKEAEQAILREFLQSVGVSFPVAITNDVATLHAYTVRGVPYTVVVGKDGRIAHLKSGSSRKNRIALEDLAAAIDRALAQ